MSAALGRARAWALRQVEAGRIPHAVVGIGSSRGIVGMDAVGAATDDRYALFSLTKPIVALAAVRAIESGQLSLRAPLESAVPAVGVERQGVIRLEHLLTHTAGLAEPALDDPRPLRGLLERADQQFLPGAAQRYSSLAFEGVAAVLEHETGRPLDAHLAEIAALTTRGTLSFDVDGAHPVARAEEVAFDADALFAQRHPGAGLFGTADALLELGAHVLRAAGGASTPLIAGASMGGMLRPRTIGLPEPVPFDVHRDHGLAWHLRAGDPGLLDDGWFGHGGWAGTQWWLHPASDTCVVLLTSVAEPGRWGLDADELLNTVLGGDA